MGFLRHVLVLLEVSVNHLMFPHLPLIAGVAMILGQERYQMRVGSVCEITYLPSRDTPATTTEETLQINGISRVWVLYHQCTVYTLHSKDSGTVPVKELVYHDIFNCDFNLSFKLSRSDTCQLCDQVISEIAEQTTSVVVHMFKAQAAYAQFKQDRQRAYDDSSLKTIIFDLQQALSTPTIPTEIVFYMRQLWMYNQWWVSYNDDVAREYGIPRCWWDSLLPL